MPRATLFPSGEGAPSFAASARAAAWVGGAAALWALGAVGAAVLAQQDPVAVALVGAVPLVGLAVVAAAVGRLRVAAAFVTLAMGAAVAGHVLAHPTLAPYFTDRFPLALALTALVLAPFLGGWRVRALELGLQSTGRKPPLFPLRALDADEPEDLLPERRGHLARGIGRCYLRGLGLAGILVLDALFSLRSRDVRLHAEGDVAAVELPEGVRVRRARLVFPACELRAVDLDGERAQEARARFESDASHHVLFSWSLAGRRLEARANAMLRDADAAATLEERSLLLEEAQRLEILVATRDLLDDDRAAIRAKALRLRAVLAAKLLSEPVGPKTEGRLLAPAPALAPQMARVLEAGGLASVKRVVFVPHWIVPARDAWGEHEVVVNALTGKPDLAQGRALLDAARWAPPSHFVDAPRSAQFLPSPEPTAALLRGLREALGPRVEVAASAAESADVLLVPFVPTSDGYVNAVTGAKAADLGVPGALAVAS